ncbi:hypothetical protein [Nannocystis radixulma]|uniref:Uncharacterized protein n=1 Tax=Nannocystis radixulma TaxID=2995305 RepID=A0ABT5B898_9BACT|nr:hypothetical protein [Nannocystis radixulma]MDC0670344.1 hypothetical protein [Nannocystis radixulma]
MKSEADTPWLPFFRAASSDTGGPPAIVDEAFVRALFGGTISPFDPVRAQPFDERCSFFADAVADDPERATRYRELIAFFDENDLTRPSAIEIGFSEYAPAMPIPDSDLPPGFASRGSCLPRLIVAFTAAGSVVGVVGHVVWT